VIPGSRLVKMSQVGRVVTGTTPSRDDVDAWGYDIPFVTPSDIHGTSRFAAPERYLSRNVGQRLASRLLPQDVALVQ
jgi:type I restriction enzyme, S subunit